MKSTFCILLFLCVILSVPANGQPYSATSRIGEFLREFERAYRAGDHEWFRSAVDEDGIFEEAKATYFSLLGPKTAGDTITGLAAVPAPVDYQLPNSWIDFKIASTIPVDFLITFKRMLGSAEVTVRVPAGYRDGKIRLVGIKKIEDDLLRP